MGCSRIRAHLGFGLCLVSDAHVLTLTLRGGLPFGFFSECGLLCLMCLALGGI